MWLKKVRINAVLYMCKKLVQKKAFSWWWFLTGSRNHVSSQVELLRDTGTAVSRAGLYFVGVIIVVLEGMAYPYIEFRLLSIITSGIFYSIISVNSLLAE
jgi:hypothetical protein